MFILNVILFFSSQKTSSEVAYPDNNTNCQSWAASGECAKNPGYMKINWIGSCYSVTGCRKWNQLMWWHLYLIKSVNDIDSIMQRRQCLLSIVGNSWVLHQFRLHDVHVQQLQEIVRNLLRKIERVHALEKSAWYNWHFCFMIGQYIGINSLSVFFNNNLDDWLVKTNKIWRYALAPWPLNFSYLVIRI